MQDWLKSERERFIAQRSRGNAKTAEEKAERQRQIEQAERDWPAEEQRHRDFILNDPEAEKWRNWFAELASNRARYNEMGRWIKQAQIDAGERPWDSYTKP